MSRNLWIAVGKNRQSSFVDHHEVTWKRLSANLLNIRRTPETFAEYMASSKDVQLATKDVGCFVGGKFAGDTRRKDELVLRSVLCLDLDHATRDVLDSLDMTYGNYEYVVHSTHKHTTERPRLRLVFPLSRDVTIHEYEPVAREVASWLGMESFDSTGFQPARVMFWPSASVDGDSYVHHNEGAWIDPDVDVLAYMPEWEDPFTWPLCPTEKAAPVRADVKVEYAPDKKGIIGAFCRAYDIHRAIAEFDLPYSETGSEDRYTYIAGSSAQGAVVYDFGTQLYSHHESDPATGLNNAWDLVRKHKFGDNEESNAKMRAFAAELDDVEHELVPEIKFEDLSADEAVQDDEVSISNEQRPIMDKFRDRIDAAHTVEDFDKLVNTIAGNYDVLNKNQINQLATWINDQRKNTVGPGWTKQGIVDTLKQTRALLAGAAAVAPEDLMRLLSDYVSDKVFGAGTLVRRVSKQFWAYRDGMWSPINDETVSGIIQSVIVDLREAGMDHEPKLKALIGDKESHVVTKNVQEFLRNEKAGSTYNLNSLTDPLGLNRDYRLPVVNCKNCTIRFDAAGNMTVGEHDPNDFFTSQIDVNYDPDAVCPEWDEFVGHALGHDPLHTDEMIRHLEEFGGYVINYSRWIKIWSLFHGPTNTGKSTFQDTLIRMLGGTSVLSRSLGDPAWDSAFGLISVLGKLLIADDDMERSVILNDGLLKKFSEDKATTAEVKFAEALSFRSRAFFMINSNHWPRVRDLSDAMRDRAFVMPFKFNFKEAGIASDQKRIRMFNEMPGILNRFLAGLGRLRARGAFKYPAPCTEARDRWLSRANPISHFVSEYMVKYPNAVGGAKRSDVYTAYLLWYTEEYGRQSGMHNSKSDTLQKMADLMGAPTKYEGEYVFRHWTMKEELTNEF